MNSEKQEVFLNKLSSRITSMRKQKGFTQEKLAEEADLDRVALANIETGRRRPTITTLYKLAEAMKIDIVDLFKGL